MKLKHLKIIVWILVFVLIVLLIFFYREYRIYHDTLSQLNSLGYLS